MQPFQFNLLADDLSRPIDALGLLTRALRNRTEDGEAEIILDEVELGLEQVRRQLSSVLDLARAEHCLAGFEPSAFALSTILDRLTLQTDRVAYDTRARLTVVRTSTIILSDRNALEIVLRSLLITGLHLARGGRVVVGARRRANGVHVQVWAKPPNGRAAADPVVALGDPQNASGLILGIARSLAEGLGHDLHFRPLSSGGIVLSIALPFERESGKPAPEKLRAAEECA